MAKAFNRNARNVINLHVKLSLSKEVYRYRRYVAVMAATVPTLRSRTSTHLCDLSYEYLNMRVKGECLTFVGVKMETNLSITNCSSSPLTSTHLIYILGSMGAVSLGVCLVALCWLFYLKLHKQFLYRLAAYQVMASLFHALLLVSQFTFLEYNESKYPSCVAVGYLFTMAAWMKTCFGCWITFHLFCFAVFLRNMRKLEPLYVISSILVPIVVSTVPLITNAYGPTGEWCWVRRKECGHIDLDGVVEQIAVWYGPALVLLVLQCIAMLMMMIIVYYRAHRKSGENVFGRDQNNVAFRQLLPLVAYPALFCILIIPPLIARVYGFASSTPNHSLLMFLAICVPAWSLSAGMTLIVHIGAMKLSKIMRILLLSRAKDSTLTITEEPTSDAESIPRDISRLLGTNKDDTRSSTYFSVPSDK